MYRQVGTVKGLLLLAISAVLFVTHVTAVTAQSSIAELVVPETEIIVQGRTSPGAQLSIFLDEQLTASVTAASTGTFSASLSNLSANIYNVGVESTDNNGIKTARLTKNVAVANQQATTVNFFIPPSIVAQPQSQVFGDTSIVFSGRTFPNADVKISFAGVPFSLSGRAKQDGSYSIVLASSSLGVGIFSYTAYASVLGDNSEITGPNTILITPPLPVTQSPTTSDREPSRPDSQQVPRTTPSMPEITFPDQKEYESNGPIVIRGTAVPFSEILIFDGDQLIGTVFSDEKGNWEFYFAPYLSEHILRTRACAGRQCSQDTEEIRIVNQQVDTVCKTTLTLKNFRLTARTGKEVSIQSDHLFDSPTQTAVVYWGEGNEERFSIAQNQPLEAVYVYDNVGIYNGYVLVSNNRGCTSVAYFTASVIAYNPKSVLFTIAAIVPLLLGLTLYFVKKNRHVSAP
jgi:hypothetical protein